MLRITPILDDIRVAHAKDSSTADDNSMLNDVTADLEFPNHIEQSFDDFKEMIDHKYGSTDRLILCKWLSAIKVKYSSLSECQIATILDVFHMSPDFKRMTVGRGKGKRTSA